MSELAEDVHTEEFVAPEQDNAVETQSVEETVVQKRVEPQDDAQERNWRQARHAMAEQKRQIEYLQSQLEEVRRGSQPKEEELADDDFVRANHLNKKIGALEQRLAQKEAEMAVQSLVNQYSDFNEVVSAENLELLKQNDPELARSLLALQSDPYAQAKAAYKMLKKQDYIQTRQHVEDKQRVADNSKKPSSVQAIRKQGPLAEANRFAAGLTPELKKSLQKEMAEARKRAY